MFFSLVRTGRRKLSTGRWYERGRDGDKERAEAKVPAEGRNVFCYFYPNLLKIWPKGTLGRGIGSRGKDKGNQEQG